MTLPPLPEESFQRVLCVVAHPDDMEYGTSAAVARWTARGIEVGYLLLTRGEAGMPNPPEETARLRVAEQHAACAVVGVTHLTVLQHPDGVLVYGLDLRRDICREIRRYQPDVVLGTGYDIETPYGFEQADHRAAGLATLDAIRDAGNRWVFPEQIDDEDLAPHTVRWYVVPGRAGSATHGVDVTGEPLRRGVASLEAHTAYLAALPDHPAPQDIIPTFAAMSGKAMGVEHAVLFRAHDLQAPFELSAESEQNSPIPRFHLAVPVDDLAAAARFYGEVLGLTRGRSADTWVDWNLDGHQFVTHLAPGRAQRVHNPVDGHDVPVPHFGLILTISRFNDLAERLRTAGTAFVIEPHVRFAGQTGEQWTMFLLDPAGNALEFKAFADDSQVFAT